MELGLVLSMRQIKETKHKFWYHFMVELLTTQVLSYILYIGLYYAPVFILALFWIMVLVSFVIYNEFKTKDKTADNFLTTLLIPIILNALFGTIFAIVLYGTEGSLIFSIYWRFTTSVYLIFHIFVIFLQAKHCITHQWEKWEVPFSVGFFISDLLLLLLSWSVLLPLQKILVGLDLGIRWALYGILWKLYWQITQKAQEDRQVTELLQVHPFKMEELVYQAKKIDKKIKHLLKINHLEPAKRLVKREVSIFQQIIHIFQKLKMEDIQKIVQLKLEELQELLYRVKIREFIQKDRTLRQKLDHLQVGVDSKEIGKILSEIKSNLDVRLDLARDRKNDSDIEKYQTTIEEFDRKISINDLYQQFYGLDRRFQELVTSSNKGEIDYCLRNLLDLAKNVQNFISEVPVQNADLHDLIGKAQDLTHDLKKFELELKDKFTLLLQGKKTNKLPLFPKKQATYALSLSEITEKDELPAILSQLDALFLDWDISPKKQ